MKNKTISSFSSSTIILFVCLLLSLSSCNSYKKISYLKNSDQLTEQELAKTAGVHELVLMPNDVISITVNSTIKGAAADFNLPMVPTNLNSAIQSTLIEANSSSGSMQNYLIDKDGEVNFPVLGKLKLSGLTPQEAQEYITSLIYPQYIIERPIVNIRLINFKVSVLGEVKNPGIYSTENGQMTILDALAAAGDMTIYGKRNNVLRVRIKDNGQIETVRINLQDEKLLLNEDILYMQQNDKLYVDANKTRGNDSSIGNFERLGLSLVSILISITALITR